MAVKSMFIKATIICTIAISVGLEVNTDTPPLERPLSKGIPSTNKTDEEIEKGTRILARNGCGGRKKRVGHGVDADAWEFPWMALLIYSDGLVESVLCGGTLISSRYVLTAAHCIRTLESTLVKVRLNEHDIAEDVDCRGRGKVRSCRRKLDFEIKEAIYHHDYNFHTGANDIGIVRTARRICFKGIRLPPICLPYGSYVKGNFSKYQIAGWGTIETGMRARILQKADVTFDYDVTYCQRIYQIMPITDKQICLRIDNGVTSCTGDSGGPLFGNTIVDYVDYHVQFGIMSYGDVNCGSTKPDVFTKVEPYLNWIFGNIRR